MANTDTPGANLRNALTLERPLQMVGAVNAYAAILAEHAGFRALYLSGAGVANASYGLPDLGLTSRDNVLEDIRRITRASALPLLVDADTGYGDVARTVTEFSAAGAAGLHLEDQVDQKRCGHRPNKRLVSCEEMVQRIQAAVRARSDASFVIMARSDAFAAEGADGALQRIEQYIAAGADMIFPEALTTLDHYRRITAAVRVPVLANITEFGKTPLFTLEELKSADIAIALYPLTAFRAMSKAAWETLATLRRDGTQKSMIDKMQTRDELYRHLDYYRHEQALNAQLEPGDDDR